MTVLGTGGLVGVGIGVLRNSSLTGAVAGGTLQALSSYGSLLRLIQLGISGVAGIAGSPEQAAKALLGASIGGC